MTKRQLRQAQAELDTALELATLKIAPASQDFILKSLTALAQVFSAPLPEEMGLLLYVQELQDLPKRALQEGCKALVGTHKWPRLPFPVEIKEASAPCAARLRFEHRRLDRAQKNLTYLLHRSSK